MNAVPFHKGDYKLLMRRIGKAPGGTLYECPICKEQVLSAFGAADRHWQRHGEELAEDVVEPEEQPLTDSELASELADSELALIAHNFFVGEFGGWRCERCGARSGHGSADRHTLENCVIARLQAKHR